MTSRSGRIRLLFGFLLLTQLSPPSQPVVRIGIERNIAGFTLSSGAPFRVEGVEARSAVFSTVLALNDVNAVVEKSDIERRLAIEVDGETVVIRNMDARVRVRPGGAPLEVNGRAYRGEIEVLPNREGTLTVVNELPIEDYLLGVVPNELGPDAFPAIEALKAQAVAARTYIVRNLGQFRDAGFDICATEACQVYRGLDTEHPMATEAVGETRGMIATYDGQPINALYSSTCGGRTENSENVFGQPVPYLVSTLCHYRHPEPQPFSTSRLYPSWEDGLLDMAGVRNFSEAGRFLGLGEVGAPPGGDPESMAAFIRSRFYPEVAVDSDLFFLQEQGILSPFGGDETAGVLVRLLLRKSAFQWEDARLISWDGAVFEARVRGEIRQLRLRPDAAIFKRVGDARIPVDQGAWVGGESMELRLDPDGAVEAVVFRPAPGTPTADRYSPVVRWQVHRTREELDEAVERLGIGRLDDIVVLARGPSNRPLRVRIRGTAGERVVEGPRFRTLFGLRDSLAYIDEERNRDGDLLGMSFFGNGWGHGVGMCQVGAFGMALDGATAEEILKTYYRGIEIERAY